MTTGADLRRERRAADITVVTLARHLRMSRQRVHEFERRATVTDERAGQFRAAIAEAVAQSGEGNEA